MRKNVWSIHYFEQGQALLLVVLVLVISMTIGLSVATRSIINVRSSTEEQDSQRAFSAAEAGIERAINSSTSATIAQPIQLDGQAQIKQLTVGQLSGNQILINNGTIISRDDGVDVWLVPRNADGTPNYGAPWNNGALSIYWGTAADTCSATPASNTMAALEVVTLTGTDTAPVSHHYFFDPCGTGRSAANKFDSTILASDWTGFQFRGTIPAVTNGLLVRIIPLYADTKVGIKGTSLPVQGTVIESVGSSGDAQRKLVTFKGYSKLPSEFFPHMLFWPQ